MRTWKISPTSGFLQGKGGVSAVPADGGHRRCRRGGARAARARSARPSLPSASGQPPILYNFYVFPSYSRYSATQLEAQIAAEQHMPASVIGTKSAWRFQGVLGQSMEGKAKRQRFPDTILNATGAVLPPRESILTFDPQNAASWGVKAVR